MIDWYYRDGVKEVAEYVKEFHPKLIGLTGTEEQVGRHCFKINSFLNMYNLFVKG